MVFKGALKSIANVDLVEQRRFDPLLPVTLDLNLNVIKRLPRLLEDDDHIDGRTPCQPCKKCFHRTEAASSAADARTGIDGERVPLLVAGFEIEGSFEAVQCDLHGFQGYGLQGRSQGGGRLARSRRKDDTNIMVPAPVLKDEEERLAALRSYKVLDTEFEKEYDDLCRLAAVICEAPIALITFVDRDRQWFKASIGIEVRETPRDIAFCAHAIEQAKVFEIADATKDARFADNPLVTGAPDIRFYAGQPLVTPRGQILGTLCTLDRVARVLKPYQKDALEILGRQVVTHLELRRTLAEMKRLNEDKDSFFSVIAHDLRSPFSGLLGITDMLVAEAEKMEKPELVEHIVLVNQSVHRVYDLSENLLKWAMLEQGKMTFQPEEFPVAALFEEVEAPLHETLKHKRLVLETAAVSDQMVLGDRNMLETALRNLLSNAAKFTPQGGRVWLKAESNSTELRLTVGDSGVGMSADLLEHLESGVRTPSGRGTEGEIGTGLGLTLVRQFALRHGGRLEMRSEKGVGTEATLVLPRD